MAQATLSNDQSPYKVRTNNPQTAWLEFYCEGSDFGGATPDMQSLLFGSISINEENKSGSLSLFNYYPVSRDI